MRNADRIYVIESGKVKEVGNHDELVALGVMYKSLYEKQFTDAIALKMADQPKRRSCRIQSQR